MLHWNWISQIVAQDGAPGVQEQRTLVTFEDGLRCNRAIGCDFTASDPYHVL